MQRLDAVGQVGAVAPDVLEALDDIGKQTIDGLALVADATGQADMADLNGGERHGSSLAKLVEDLEHDDLDDAKGDQPDER